MVKMWAHFTEIQVDKPKAISPAPMTEEQRRVVQERERKEAERRERQAWVSEERNDQVGGLGSSVQEDTIVLIGRFYLAGTKRVGFARKRDTRTTPSTRKKKGACGE